MCRSKLIVIAAFIFVVGGLSACAGPDLVALGIPGQTGGIAYCNYDLDTGNLKIIVGNIGDLSADSSSNTSIDFGGGPINFTTPALAVGAQWTGEVAVPAGCYQPDCGFTIKVDTLNQVGETNENNNQTNGYCLG